ncbi:hypothetical protein UPYG_G00205820 [Umbra pygmaea]|uniref:Uncharacterized protein n=1 Tax=Umbra pygmaea TaxID=75934 RepID=A0ABD0WP50_UMBPY
MPDRCKVLCDDDLIGHHAYIAYEDCLKSLVTFMTLPVDKCVHWNTQTSKECRALPPFDIKVNRRGTACIIEWVCPTGHTMIQDHYCIDTIKQFWQEKRAEIIQRLSSKDGVVALADGRMDSPGHCAQYCTYTTMDNDTKEIISIVTVDKRETMRNSVIMEKEAFIRTVDQLLTEVNLKEICTDAHVQISALMNQDRGKYKDTGIRHTLDMWHGAKGLAKRINAAGQQSGQGILLLWSKDIVNHFWWCCKQAETYKQFLELWCGILHVSNEHVWALGKCQHDCLVEGRSKAWIEQRSSAHSALSDIIYSKRWLKDIPKYLNFRSTSDLESFQNQILMYAGKRFAFSPPVYEARTILAALDYNHHRDRPAKERADGTKMYRRLYKKKSRSWSVYAVKKEKTYDYIPDLQRKILEKRLSSGTGLKRTASHRPEDPQRLGNLPDVPPPSIQELVQTQVSRGRETV